MTIKAIPTYYAGHYFRSRLEARWAAFFDAMGIRWVYEPEGVELNSGRYLPDFLLRGLGGIANHHGAIWFEVKPDNEFVATDPRWEELAITSNIPVVVAYDMPRADLGELSVIYGAARESGHIEVFGCSGERLPGHAFAFCAECDKIGITHEGRKSEVCNHAAESDRGATDARIVDAYKQAHCRRFDKSEAAE